jgi:hypothetical protein
MSEKAQETKAIAIVVNHIKTDEAHLRFDGAAFAAHVLQIDKTDPKAAAAAVKALASLFVTKATNESPTKSAREI